MVAHIARIQRPLQTAGLAIVVVSVALGIIFRAIDGPDGLPGWAGAGGLAMIVASFLAGLGRPRAVGPALALAAPFTGTWVAHNSPTSKVPSHGTHSLAQTYAADFLLDPASAGPSNPGSAAFPMPAQYPSFGQPILAVGAASVVRVHSRRRDHRAYGTAAALIPFFVLGIVRDLSGARWMLGNHVVLRLEDGSFFTYAHLRHGSIAVRKGERVVAGQQIAQCGNSGNTTQPHLHCQRQDRASVLTAFGLPWTIEPGGIPANGQAATYGEPSTVDSASK